MNIYFILHFTLYNVIIFLYKICRIFSIVFWCGSIILLSGCDNLILINSKGEIGLEERSLILTVFSLMLIIVIPVIIMTVVFCVKYRSSNIYNTQYNPNWSHSAKIEYVIWLIPILIIFVLSILTWKSTHKLDPSRSIVSSTAQSLIVHVIALDWKWLFIYPQYNIATINELVFPSCIPVQFYITSNSVMNSFFIPQLGSQIYAMAGMCTKLNLIANESGKFKGMSANFSGQGFSGMKFIAIATDNKEEFNQWIFKVRESPYHIKNISSYLELAKPSSFHAIMHFSYAKSDLFYDVIDRFMCPIKRNN